MVYRLIWDGSPQNVGPGDWGDVASGGFMPERLLVALLVF